MTFNIDVCIFFPSIEYTHIYLYLIISNMKAALYLGVRSQFYFSSLAIKDCSVQLRFLRVETASSSNEHRRLSRFRRLSPTLTKPFTSSMHSNPEKCLYSSSNGSSSHIFLHSQPFCQCPSLLAKINQSQMMRLWCFFSPPSYARSFHSSSTRAIEGCVLDALAHTIHWTRGAVVPMTSHVTTFPLRCLSVVINGVSKL